MGAIAERGGRTGVSVPDFALHWAEELGATAQGLVLLQGGINNRVYRCNAPTQQLVIKGYAPCPSGQRDRMQAEVAFLRFAMQVAPEYVPHLLHTDPQRRCVVLEYIEGETYREGMPLAAEDIDAAVAFFRRLNGAPQAAVQAGLPDAAEGFLRLTDHVANVRERIGSMQTAHLPVAARLRAESLLSRLKIDLESVATQTDTRIQGGEVVDGIERHERCVSPSDFGFHNAIRTPSGIKFIDFEFAGWDDPAKAVADFALQPRIPIGECSSRLLSAFESQRSLAITTRCKTLDGILRLKWRCIILSILQPERLAALRTTCTTTNLEQLIAERINQAERWQARTHC